MEQRGFSFWSVMRNWAEVIQWNIKISSSARAYIKIVLETFENGVKSWRLVWKLWKTAGNSSTLLQRAINSRGRHLRYFLSPGISPIVQLNGRDRHIASLQPNRDHKLHRRYLCRLICYCGRAFFCDRFPRDIGRATGDAVLPNAVFEKWEMGKCKFWPMIRREIRLFY